MSSCWVCVHTECVIPRPHRANTSSCTTARLMKHLASMGTLYEGEIAGTYSLTPLSKALSQHKKFQEAIPLRSVSPFLISAMLYCHQTFANTHHHTVSMSSAHLSTRSPNISRRPPTRTPTKTSPRSASARTTTNTPAPSNSRTTRPTIFGNGLPTVRNVYALSTTR